MGPVLRGRLHADREGRADHVSRAGTAFDLRLVLRDGQPHGRQIEHLSAFQTEDGLLAQIAAAAAGAAGEPMGHDVVGAGDRGKGVARMASLAAGRTSASDAQACGRRLGVAVG